MMFHIFEDKVKEKSLDTVVVNLYPKKGKKNTFKIKHSRNKIPLDNTAVIEGFHQHDSACKCDHGVCNQKVIRQKICKPKSQPKSILKKPSKNNVLLPTINQELNSYYSDSEPLTTSICKGKTESIKTEPDASEDLSQFYNQPQPEKIKNKSKKDILVEGFANTYKECDKLFKINIEKKTGVTEGFNILEY